MLLGVYKDPISRRSALKGLGLAAGLVTLGSSGAGLAFAQPSPTELRVLAINTWLNGTRIDNGLELVAGIIQSTGASVVLLSEARTAAADLVVILERLGLKFYSAPSEDTAVLSLYPIQETGLFEYMTKAVIAPGGVPIAVYAAHLQYQWYATYLPRGYGAGVPEPGRFAEYGWDKIPTGPVTDVAAVTQINDESGRPTEIAEFIADAALEQAKGRAVILGGDLNEPSTLDWTPATKDLFDHNGVVLPWGSTQRLRDAGFVDAYRHLYPDPVTHPGFTWPTDNPDASVSSLTWTPEADERDRIDYIFAGPSPQLTLTSAGIVGPRGSIVRNQRVEESTADNFVSSPLPWPTDHKAVIASYRLGSGPIGLPPTFGSSGGR